MGEMIEAAVTHNPVSRGEGGKGVMGEVCFEMSRTGWVVEWTWLEAQEHLASTLCYSVLCGLWFACMRGGHMVGRHGVV